MKKILVVTSIALIEAVVLFGSALGMATSLSFLLEQKATNHLLSVTIFVGGLFGGFLAGFYILALIHTYGPSCFIKNSLLQR